MGRADFAGRRPGRSLQRVSGSDINLVHHPGERDAPADVALADQPGDGSLDAEAEAAVRDRTIFTQGIRWCQALWTDMLLATVIDKCPCGRYSDPGN